MIIVEGNYGRNLSGRLAKHNNLRMVGVSADKFANRDSRVILEGEVSGEDCLIVQSMATRTNHALVELLLIADALVENGARSVKALVPFLGYSYQDRHFDREPISSRVVAKMISASDLQELVVVDIHSERVLDFFTIPVKNWKVDDLFGDYVRSMKMEGYTVVSPDRGSELRSRSLAEKIGSDLALFNKKRNVDSLEVVALELVEGKVGEKCIIFDDSVNSGGTMVKVSELLRDMGAKEVVWMITHFLGVEGSFEKVMKSCDLLVTTNSIDHGLEESEKVKILDLSEIIEI